MTFETSEPADSDIEEPPEDSSPAGAEPGEVEGDASNAGDADIALPAGDALNYAEASAVMKVVPARVILVAGENDAGKTSLLCAIYERFLRGEFAGQRFCGSQTLLAYERRSFLQRPESGLDEPDTERTRLPAGELALLHLELEGKTSAHRQAVLETDLAGEAFRLIRDNPAECENYAVLSRVDCLTVLLDGRRLTATKERHGHVNATRTMLRSLLQSDELPGGVPIFVAISKWDLLDTDGLREMAVADAHELLDVVGSNPTEIFRIAPAPQSPSSIEPAHGVAGLLRAWIDAAPEEVPVDVDPAMQAEGDGSPFQEFRPPEPGA